MSQLRSVSTLLKVLTMIVFFLTPFNILWQSSSTGVPFLQNTSTPARIIYLPLILKSPAIALSEWTQHAHDAQRTSYTNQIVTTPWRWKWAWNGPNASGGISSGKFGLPRNSQPITGGGRVYIAAGSRGVYALNNANGNIAWNRNPGGNINSTPAYDAQTEAIFVLSSNGVLYKLDAATGDPLAQFATNGKSDLPLPPALVDDRLIISMGQRVFAINKYDMTQIWAYGAGSPVHTPPAYSPSRNYVIVASEDLYVHAINNTNGAQAWRVKPTPLSPGNPAQDSDLAEVKNGWPVIAETHGLVLIKLRLDWQALWQPNPWPSSNSSMRSTLSSQPKLQSLFVLRLDDGSVPFIANIGHGGFGDGGYLPMGPQAVVKPLANGQEVAYVVMRGSPCAQTSCDGRWDSHLGELLLDGTTVSGYSAGYVRFIRNTFFPTDEQAYVAMAGDYIFGGHWEAGIAHKITDRSAARGSGTNPIQTSDLPHIVTSQDADTCGQGFQQSHYCSQSLKNTRLWPAGFYIYWQKGTVYDQYWSEYAGWVVSNNTIYFVSTDGAVVALEHGNPTVALLDSLVTTTKAEIEPQQVVKSNTITTNIYYTQTRAHVGREAIVSGPIRYVFNNGLAVLLGFENPHQGAFKVRILKKDWDNFAASPETIYSVGQQIQVAGKIEWYQGDPVIYIQTPTQLKLLQTH
jgi:outer membrane protein assembly factor BamB